MIILQINLCSATKDVTLALEQLPMEIHESSTVPLLLSQWKGYSNIDEVEQFIKEISSHPEFSEHQHFLALPTPLLRQFSKRSIPAGIILGAKTMDSVMPGAFTETIAIPLVKRADAKFVMVGSSDSRQVLHETNESINLKIRKLLEAGIQPVLCIGETLDENQQGIIVNVLADQLREGLRGLTPPDQAKVIILYEAAPMFRGTKKYTLEDCQMAYDNCQEAMRQILPEEILPQIKIIYTFPDEPLEYKDLVGHNTHAGFYAESAEDFFPFLDSLAKIEEGPTHKPIAKEPKPRRTISKIESQAEEKLQPSPAGKISSLAKKKIEEGVEEREEIESEISEEKEAREEKEGTASKAHFEALSVEEKEGKIQPSTVEAYSTDLTEPLLKEPSISNALDFTESTETGTEEKVSTSEFAVESEAIPSAQPGRGAMQEEAPLLAPQESTAKIVEEPSEDHERDYATRITDLTEDDTTLATMYTTMQEKVTRMTELRTNYPIYLEKVSHELNLLDPDLQGYISQGNLEFFKDHPELFDRAKSTFVHVQNLNELIMEAGAIPREIDRLKSKSKKLREKLQNDWDFLNAHRLEMKKIDPDHLFPAQPKTLQAPPPEIDLTLQAVSGPSPLLQKRIGVVKKSKSAES